MISDKSSMLDYFAPFPAGYYTQQCQCMAREIDRMLYQNAQLACNAALVDQCQPYVTQYMGIPYDAERERRGHRRTRYSGSCPHCGAPVDAYAEKCAYCDCYYD